MGVFRFLLDFLTLCGAVSTLVSTLAVVELPLVVSEGDSDFLAALGWGW